MAIKHKRKNSSGYTWQSSDLVEGQIGLNIADGTLHFKKADNTVVTIAEGTGGGGGLTAVVDDTSPELGGDLDVGNYAITSDTGIWINSIDSADNANSKISSTNLTGDGSSIYVTRNSVYFEAWTGDNDDPNPYPSWYFNSDGTTQFPGFMFPATDGTSGQVLVTDGSGSLSWATASGSGGLADVVDDTTPQLGGNLDVNGHKIVSTSNGNIILEPNGTGKIEANSPIINTSTLYLSGGNPITNSTQISLSGTVIDLNPGTGSVTIDGLNWPTSDGTANYHLVTNGSGTLSWSNNIAGNAASATYASAVTLTADNTTNATNYPLFASAATGNLSPRTDTGFTYNPSTGVLTSTTFSGALSGNASSATYASAVTLTADNTTNATNYPLFASASTGNLSPRTDTGFTYNPSTGALSTSILSGAKLDGYTETVYSITYNANITPNWTNGTVQTVTLTGNTAFAAPSNMVAGSSLTIIIKQDGSGGRTASWNASYKFAGGTPVLSTTASYIDVVTVFYDGTDYLASIAKQDTSTSILGLVINAQGELRLADSDSSNYVGFKSPATVSANKIWTLPSADGTANQVLATNGSGTLSWNTVSSGPSVAVISSTVSAPYQLTCPTSSTTTIAAAWTESTDANNIVTVSGNTFTLGAGTYIIEYDSDNAYCSVTPTSANTLTQSPNWLLYLYNTTDSSTVAQWSGLTIKTTPSGTSALGFNWQPRIVVTLTLAGTKTFDLRYDSFSGSNNTVRSLYAWYSQAATVKITKVA